MGKQAAAALDVVKAVLVPGIPAPVVPEIFLVDIDLFSLHCLKVATHFSREPEGRPSSLAFLPVSASTVVPRLSASNLLGIRKIMSSSAHSIIPRMKTVAI